MKASGTKTSNMVSAKFNTHQAAFTSAISFKVKNMDKVNECLHQAIFIQANGDKVKDMGKVVLSMLMVGCIKDKFLIVKKMVLVKLLGLEG